MRFSKHKKDPTPKHPTENPITWLVGVFFAVFSWLERILLKKAKQPTSQEITDSTLNFEKQLIGKGFSADDIHKAHILRESLLNQGYPDIARPVVLFNSSTFQLPVPALSPEMLSTAGETVESIQRLVIDPEELQLFSITREQEKMFKNGEPVLVRYGLEPYRKKRSSGGQVKDPIEKLIYIGLSTAVYVAVEKLCYLMSFRDQLEFRYIQDHRDLAFGLLTEKWPKADKRRLTREKRLSHLDALWHKGRRPEVWRALYSVSNINKIIEKWAKTFEQAPKEKLLREIDFQSSLVLGLLHCEIRAKEFRKTISNVSDKVSQSREESKGDRAILSGLHPEHHCTYADVLPAAFIGNVNPADLFLNLESYREPFEIMRLIGCLSRGYQIDFLSEHLQITSWAIKNLEEWLDNPWAESNPAEAARAFWAKAMLSVMHLEKWKCLYDQAVKITKSGAKEGEITIT